MRTLSILIACLAIGWQVPAAADPNMQRQTRFGAVVGSDDSAGSGTHAWKGIPFAQPPVGALRWKAPVDPQKWHSPRAAQQFGNACGQYGRIYGPGLNNTYDPTIDTSLNQAWAARIACT
jgi:para-nitrobenzyl esterase